MTAVREPVRTDRVRSDYADLSARIRAAGLLERRTGYYVAKFALTLGAFAAVWTAFVLIEQAKGVLAARAGLPVSEAFTRMRTHARRSGITLTAVAAAVVNGSLDRVRLGF